MIVYKDKREQWSLEHGHYDFESRQDAQADLLRRADVHLRHDVGR